MSRAPVAWVLNLDAELELEAGARYTPPAALVAATSAARAHLRALLPPDDVVLDVDPDAGARGLIGRCFCPTRSALRRLERAGARAAEAPSMEVLARVNERGFALALHRLDGALRCTDEEAVARAITLVAPLRDGTPTPADDGRCRPSVTPLRSSIARGERWLLKRGLGFAGRGQRKIDSGEVSEADRAWIRASLRRGALYVEPRVAIALEVALHGRLARDGTCERGEPTVQRVVSGAWSGSWRAAPGELHDHERRLLTRSFDEVTAALHQAGYFGPFGVDAFRYHAEDGEHFQPLSEINARYTMAWGTGMGAW